MPDNDRGRDPLSERMARLETRVDILVRDHTRLEAHLDNQDHTMSIIRDNVGILTHNRAVFSKVAHWLAMVAAAAAGYIMHFLLPPRS